MIKNLEASIDYQAMTLDESFGNDHGNSKFSLSNVHFAEM